jgi:hypothetical protein
MRTMGVKLSSILPVALAVICAFVLTASVSQAQMCSMSGYKASP